ncbi:hypothetical protein [Vibrio misgurnus]|nr:hypothetical protein [Vibrio sp. VCS]
MTVRAKVGLTLQALGLAIEAGERSGQCSLSLHDIAAKVKQKLELPHP